MAAFDSNISKCTVFQMGISVSHVDKKSLLGFWFSLDKRKTFYHFFLKVFSVVLRMLVVLDMLFLFRFVLIYCVGTLQLGLCS